jgi:hypothetical protein
VLQEPQDLLVLLAHLVAQQEQRELRVKDRQVLQDYLVSTELQGLQVFAELQEAQVFKVSKELQDCRVLLALVHLELQEPRDNKGQSGQKDQLGWSALAELQD